MTDSHFQFVVAAVGLPALVAEVGNEYLLNGADMEMVVVEKGTLSLA